MTSDQKTESSSLLVKVKLRKGKVAGVEPVGVVNRTVKFLGLADVQYLTSSSFTGTDCVSSTKVSALIIFPTPCTLVIKIWMFGHIYSWRQCRFLSFLTRTRSPTCCILLPTRRTFGSLGTVRRRKSWIPFKATDARLSPNLIASSSCELQRWLFFGSSYLYSMLFQILRSYCPLGHACSWTASTGILE